MTAPYFVGCRFLRVQYFALNWFISVNSCFNRPFYSDKK
ncbi:hypothetical protein BMETH_1910_0 [methanotrophic bacterial endosymbiont of Bathymodiolus sp.]|nr:hypothetical protein BMETH_1910_0 [methanotrophic bacterial endosymbiont of Bathymodiolus sp.]